MMRKRVSIHLGKPLPKNFVQPQPAGFYSCSFLGLIALCSPSEVHWPLLTPGKGKYFSTICRIPSTESCSPFVGDILLCCTCKCTCNLM